MHKFFLIKIKYFRRKGNVLPIVNFPRLCHVIYPYSYALVLPC
jgi:hypothetical protein